MARLEVQFTNSDAAAALIAAKLDLEALAAEHPHIPELAELADLLQQAHDGLDIAVMHDATAGDRRCGQRPARQC